MQLTLSEPPYSTAELRSPRLHEVGLGTGTVWGQPCAGGGDAEEQKREGRAGSRADLTFLVNVHFLEFKFPKSPAVPEKKDL